MKMRYLMVLVLCLLVLPVSAVHAQANAQMVEVLQQLTKLESEVRQLRGEVEGLTHENKRLKSQQNDLYVDLDQRLRKVESGKPSSQFIAESTGSVRVDPSVPVTGNFIAAPTVPAVSAQATHNLVIGSQPITVQPVPNTPVAVPGDPAKEQAAYKDAFNLLKVGKYDEAILAYSNFLRKYPSGQYAANAQYWLGEANYVTRQFPAASTEFEKVISLYPTSRKLPDAMLKIGYIHYELKQSDDARRVLSELTQKFPGTTAARLAENRLQRMKLEGR